MRQSVQETTTGPILWYGRFVDYGNFNEAICKNGLNKDSIMLRFDLNFPLAFGNGLGIDYISKNVKHSSLKTTDISIELHITEHDKKH